MAVKIPKTRITAPNGMGLLFGRTAIIPEITLTTITISVDQILGHIILHYL